MTTRTDLTNPRFARFKFHQILNTKKQITAISKKTIINKSNTIQHNPFATQGRLKNPYVTRFKFHEILDIKNKLFHYKER